MHKTHPLYKYRKRWFNNKSLKVLDLFAGTQSVRKALEEMNINFEYKGIDIYSPEEENIILDLSRKDLPDVLGEATDKFIPDFIWASPLCTTFSIATAIPGGTLAYVVDRETETISIRQEFAHITHKNYFHLKDNPEWIKAQQEKGQLGFDLMENTKLICNAFSDLFGTKFAIEQPLGAYSKYLLKEFKKNGCNYCAYGFQYKKPTAIYSNKTLNLKRCTHKSHPMTMSGDGGKPGLSGNKNRSRVPLELIKDVITQSMI